MNKSTPWKAPYLSWFSRDLYRGVVSEWHGIAFGYLFVLIAVIFLIICTRMGMMLQNSMGMLDPIIDQFPVMTFKDGELSIDKPSPYTVKGPQDLGTVAVFDTGDGPKHYPNVLLLLTKHNIIFQTEARRVSTAYGQSDGEQAGTSDTTGTMRGRLGANEIPYSTMPDGVVDSQAAKRFVHGIALAASVGILLLWGPFTFATLAVWSLAAALFIRLILEQSIHVTVSYAEAVRLAVVAQTPALLLVTAVVLAIPQAYPAGIILGGLLALGYMIFAMTAMKVRPASALDSAGAGFPDISESP